MRSLYSILVYLIGALWIPACGQQHFDEKMASLYRGTVPLIQARELQEMEKGSVYLLDTRTHREYEVSHLPGARFIDYEHFSSADVTDIPKDAQVITYCSVGYRSERIGEKLQKLGYQNVKNLYGGIFDWKNQGYQVINLNEKTTDSVHTYNENWSQWLYNGIKVYE